MEQATPWGIALGHTHSAVARVDALGRPEVIENREGQTTVGTVLLMWRASLLV